MVDLPGLIVPPLTPFTDDLAVDYPRLARQVDYVLTECRPAMVCAAGVETQEYHYLSLDQRKELIRRTVEFVGGRAPVAVGVSHPAVGTVLDLVELAASLGAHAVQLLAPLRPFGGAPSTTELVAYFRAVAERSPLPVILYLNPGPGADVSIEATVELTRIDNIAYVKESSRDLARVSRLIVEIDLAGHARYFTTMQMLLATLMLGGAGAAMPPPGAAIARLVVDAFLAKDFERAAVLQREFALFPARWMGKGLAPVMKAAMAAVGLPMGAPYPPFPPLTADESASLEAHLATTSLSRAEAA